MRSVSFFWTGARIIGGLVLCTLLLACVQSLSAPPSPERLPQLTPQSFAHSELGRALFFDRRLSGDGTMSCAVCHIPDQAFADGREISGAYPTNRHWRNTQTLLNVAYLQNFFWDGRSDSLVHQVRGPIESPFEMNSQLDYIRAKLSEVPAYRQRFQEAFGGEVTNEAILQALAAFELTLTVTDSPYDRVLAGDDSALSALAEQGRQLFFGPRGGCSQCHSTPLLSDQQYHNLGIAETPDLLNDPQHRATRRYMLAYYDLPMLPRDPGRFLVSKNPAEMGAFRTPPLRQVAQTAPYMHNGSLKTLAEVVVFFNNGGGDDPQKSPLLRKLNLTSAEQTALVAFLESLSGTIPGVTAPPLPGE